MTFVPGDRSFNEFNHAQNAPGLSLVSVYDTDFITSD